MSALEAPYAVDDSEIPEWTVGDRLRKARERRHISVGDMAVRLGRSTRSVTTYERTVRIEDIDRLVLRAYAEETNTPLVWIVTGQPPASGSPLPNGYSSDDRWWLEDDELTPCEQPQLDLVFEDCAAA